MQCRRRQACIEISLTFDLKTPTPEAPGMSDRLSKSREEAWGSNARGGTPGERCACGTSLDDEDIHQMSAGRRKRERKRERGATLLWPTNAQLRNSLCWLLTHSWSLQLLTPTPPTLSLSRRERDRTHKLSVNIKANKNENHTRGSFDVSHQLISSKNRKYFDLLDRFGLHLSLILLTHT